MGLKEDIEQLKKEVEQLRRERLANLSVSEVESLKNYIFDRTAATLASGASLNQYVILTMNGKRTAIPGYDKFNPIV